MSDETSMIRSSSGNVFADLGLPRPEEAEIKAVLAHQIGQIISRRGWSQVRAAEAIGIDQPKISALIRGRLNGFSTERLLGFLVALDQEVEILVRPKAEAQPKSGIRVTVQDRLLPSATVLPGQEPPPHS